MPICRCRSPDRCCHVFGGLKRAAGSMFPFGFWASPGVVLDEPGIEGLLDCWNPRSYNGWKDTEVDQWKGPEDFSRVGDLLALRVSRSQQ